ncbi:MAG: tetratricopeptide repeat protein [bacterium]
MRSFHGFTDPAGTGQEIQGIMKQMERFRDIVSMQRVFIVGSLMVTVVVFLPLRQPCARDSGIPEDLVTAVNFFHEGLYEEALKGFESVIRRDPNSNEAIGALFYSAECLYALNRWDEAVERYTAFRTYTPERDCMDRLFPHLPDALEKAGNLSGAIRVFEEWLAIHHDTAPARRIEDHLFEIKNKLVEQCMEAGRYAEAKDIIEELVGKAEDKQRRVELEEMFADCLFFLKRWQHAIDAYEKVRKEHAGDSVRAGIDQQILLARYALGQWDRVMDDADRFLALDPEGPGRDRVMYIKAWVLYQTGRYKQAVDCLPSQSEGPSPSILRRAESWIHAEDAMLRWELGPAQEYFERIVEGDGPHGHDYWLAHLRLAESLWRSWNFSKARLVFQRIREGDADEELKILASAQEGEFYRENGWFGPAYEALSFVTQGDMEGVCGDRVLVHAAESLCRIKRYQEARDLLQRSILLYPDGAYAEETRWKIAELWFDQGDFNTAIDVITDFMQRYPGSPFSSGALYRLGWSHIYLGHMVQAEEVFTLLLDKDCGEELSSRTLLALGQIRFHRGDYAGALKSLADCIQRAPDGKIIQKAKFFRALAHFRAGDLDPARAEFQELIEKPGNDESREALVCMGLIWQAEKRYKNAGSAFGRFLESYPEPRHSVSRLYLLWRLAQNAYLLGDYQGAMHWIDLILCEATPTLYHESARALALQCLLDQKEYKDYLEQYAVFLDNRPQVGCCVSDDFTQARAMAEKGELQDAARVYKDLSLECAGLPEEVDALVNLGMTLEGQGLHKTALRIYLLAMGRCRQDVQRMRVHEALGEILFREKAYEIAGPHFKKAAALSSSPEISARGAFFSMLNDYVHARNPRTFERLKALVHGNILDDIPVGKIIELGLFLEDASEHVLAIHVFHRVLDSEADASLKAEAQYWIGQCYHEKGDLDEAAEAYLRVAHLYPEACIWAITGRFKSAEIYQQMGYLDKALELFEKVERAGKGESYEQFAAKRVMEIKRLINQKKGGGQ